MRGRQNSYHDEEHGAQGVHGSRERVRGMMMATGLGAHKAAHQVARAHNQTRTHVEQKPGNTAELRSWRIAWVGVCMRVCVACDGGEKQSLTPANMEPHPPCSAPPKDPARPLGWTRCICPDKPLVCCYHARRDAVIRTRASLAPAPSPHLTPLWREGCSHYTYFL